MKNQFDSFEEYLANLVSIGETTSETVEEFKDRFKHIYAKGSSMYNTPQFSRYIFSLMAVSDTGRQGFPLNIFSLLNCIVNNDYWYKLSKGK